MVMQSVEAEVTVTSDDTDAFQGTDLERMPGPGAVAVFLSSTVADSRATVQVDQKVLKSDSLISKVIANAQIDIMADAAMALQVRGGERLKVALDVVSAATIRAKALWTGVLR